MVVVTVCLDSSQEPACRMLYSLREHQRAGGADPDAVAAVHAGRVGQADVELGGDPGVEAPAGDRDGEGVLGILAAGLHALVAQDAARVVADVAVVVVLDRLGDRLGRGPLSRWCSPGRAASRSPAACAGAAAPYRPGSAP